MNIIEQQFNKTVTRLAGNEYGRKVYDEQARNKIDFSEKTQIVFPDQIIAIASSFIQGCIIGHTRNAAGHGVTAATSEVNYV